MLNFIIVLLYFLSIPNLSHTNDTSTATSPLKKTGTQNKFISVNAACSRKALLAIVVLKEPFHGILYARGYPIECSVLGDGSNEAKLSFTVDQCGTKIIEKPDGSLQFDVYLYLQYERHVQQASDEIIQVQCVPQDVVVSSRIAPAKPGQADVSLTTQREASTTPIQHLAFVSWMDILRGKMPTAVPITEYVNVGEEVTMLIKIRHADNVQAKVIECIASDGTKDNEQLLIDSNGCSVDPTIMPNLQEKYNAKTGVKMLFSTFNVFRFPERDNLHMQCRVLVCNVTCPLESCAKSMWSTRGRVRATRASSGLQRIVDELDVFNTVEVKTPLVDVTTRRPVSVTSNHKEALLKEITAAPPIVKPETMFCLNSTRMVAIICVLLGVLLISLVITICTCVRARELRRRLLQSQSFPYGRVHEYS